MRRALVTAIVVLMNANVSHAALMRLSFDGSFSISDPILVGLIGDTLAYAGEVIYDDSSPPGLVTVDGTGTQGVFPYQSFSLTVAGQTIGVSGTPFDEISSPFDDVIRVHDSSTAVSDNLSAVARPSGSFLVNGHQLMDLEYSVQAADVSSAFSGIDLQHFNAFPDRLNQVFDLGFSITAISFDLRNNDDFGYSVSAVPLPASLWLVLSGLIWLGTVGRFSRRATASRLPPSEWE